MFFRNSFSDKLFQVGKVARTLREFVAENDVDVIHTQHLRMAQYTAGLNNSSTVLDLPDAYSLYWKRRSVQKKIRLRIL
ncbi:MAG: hypothetical protein IPM96_21570 [Ignavibacteria bacterium]|nr:hypothetical protein [Ignavibacteria bacterium]